MMARGLVMWDDIQPTEDWINSNIPPVSSPVIILNKLFTSLWLWDVYIFGVLSVVSVHVMGHSREPSATRFDILA